MSAMQSVSAWGVSEWVVVVDDDDDDDGDGCCKKQSLMVVFNVCSEDIFSGWQYWRDFAFSKSFRHFLDGFRSLYHINSTRQHRRHRKRYVAYARACACVCMGNAKAICQ